MKALPQNKSLPSTVEITPLAPGERETILALKAEGKRRKAERAKAQSKSGFTPPELRMDAAQRMTNFVIKRIEFPRKGEPFYFSPTDRADAQAVGIAACMEAGFFHHGQGGVKILRAIRNKIQGRECLRLRCKWEETTNDAAGVAAAVGFATEMETVERRLTHSQRDMAREIMRALRASLECDKGRKAVAAYRSHRGFFLIVLGYLTETTPREMSAGTFGTRKSRFIDYLSKGAHKLRIDRKPLNLADEIMRALSDRALA